MCITIWTQWPSGLHNAKRLAGRPFPHCLSLSLSVSTHGHKDRDIHWSESLFPLFTCSVFFSALYVQIETPAEIYCCKFFLNASHSLSLWLLTSPCSASVQFWRHQTSNHINKTSDPFNGINVFCLKSCWCRYTQHLRLIQCIRDHLRAVWSHRFCTRLLLASEQRMLPSHHLAEPWCDAVT